MIKKIVIILLLVGIVLNSNGYCATYFVDKGHVGSNQGTENNPYTSFNDVEGVIEQGDVVYVKGYGFSDPYRESLGLGANAISRQLQQENCTWYLDWTGIGETRSNSNKVHFYGSNDISGATWTQEGASDVYSTEYALGVGDYLIFADSGRGLAWKVTNENDIVTLVGTSNYPPSSVEDLTLNECYHDSDADTLYVNIGEDPTGSHIEVTRALRGIEFWPRVTIYSGSVHFSTGGIGSVGCARWTINDVESSYNDRGLTSNAGCFWEYSDLVNLRVHHNARHGIWLANNNTGQNVRLINSAIYSNGSNGYYGICGGPGANYIINCVFYGNGEKGIYVDQPTGIPATFYCYNTISEENTEEEFYATDIEGINIVADHNCTTGDYDGVRWLPGENDIADSPQLTSDYHIEITSPCRDAGIRYSDVVHDFDGQPRERGMGVDIGINELPPPINCTIN